MSLSRLSKGALDQLAHGLEAGRFDLNSAGPVHGWAASAEEPLASEALHYLSALGLSREQAASVVRLVLEERAAADTGRVTAVWTGPEGTTAQTRDTAVVVRELFESARERVLVSSYVLYQTHDLFEVLARAMEANPLLEVRLFVTVLKGNADLRSSDEVLSTFAAQFKKDWPGARLPRVFHDPRSLRSIGEGRAVLHAKCVVVDGRRTFVTSANFTEAAQQRNFELGLLADDEMLARSIESQFESLVAQRLVHELGASTDKLSSGGKSSPTTAAPGAEPQPTEEVGGIDVGLTLVDPTSGVCRTGRSGEVVAHTFIDHNSRRALLGNTRFTVLAIDAPLLAGGRLHYEVRSCEKVFVWGAFQKRCKCGESQIPGTGAALRRAGAETASAFKASVSSTEVARAFPRILGPQNVLEAFPSAFLGVAVPEASFRGWNSDRSGKFDWLYDEWLRRGVNDRLQRRLSWGRDGFWQQVREKTNHDERAALICALTGICVLRGEYVAVGEPSGGYFFLPPWDLWAPWARSALDENRTDPRLPKPVEVWINGDVIQKREPLPLLVQVGSTGGT